MSSFDETIKSLTDQAQQLGAMKEQQRIIKLLEKELAFHEPVVINRHKLIALIKGEK